MLKFDFVAARSVDEAVGELESRGPGGKVLAGGTDLLLQIKAHAIHPGYVVDVSRIADLQRMEDRDGAGIFIGSASKMRALQHSPVLQERYRIIVDGVKLVGSIQIRNLATIGGNVCNAAPSADVAAPLLATGAVAEIAGPGGRRDVSIDEFFLGPRRTVLGPSDVLVGVRVPAPARRSGGHYLRHTPRKEMDIAVVGVASAVTLDDGHCADARIALAAVAPTPIRARRAEDALRGKPLTDELIEHAAQVAMEEARPITDVRGTAEFRRHLVGVLTRRTLTVARQQARGELT